MLISSFKEYTSIVGSRSSPLSYLQGIRGGEDGDLPDITRSGGGEEKRCIATDNCEIIMVKNDRN